MNWNILQPCSLKTRVTLFTLAVFLASFWSLAFYVSRVLQEDTQHLVSDQQFSMASFIAASVDDELGGRLRAMEKIAATAAPAILHGTVAMQTFLEQSVFLQDLFNMGLLIVRSDGTAMAEIPLPAKRIGANYMERDFMIGALKEGKATIGKPVMGETEPAPVIGMAVPIRDSKGKVIGALMGVINLAKPSFLRKIEGSAYGHTGGYLIVAPNRLIVAATDKTRIMETLPTPGINPLIDRFVDGYEGYGLIDNPYGLEVLASAKGIPVAGWFVVVMLPAAEAFAPIHGMQQRMLLAAIFLTLLAGGLTWWMLRRQLSPMLAAAKMLADMSDVDHAIEPLPVTRQDEIGQFIGGFNNLMETLGKREKALKLSEQRFRDIANTTEGIVWEADATTFTFTFASKKAESLLGFPASDWLKPGFWVAHLHPDDRIWAPEFCASCTSRLEPHDFEYRFIAKDGRSVWLRDIVTVVAEDGRPRWLRGIMVDITKSKQMEAVLRDSEERYRAVAQSANDAIVTADSAGNIANWNRGAEVIFGYTESEAIGVPLTMLMPPRYHDQHIAGFGRNADISNKAVELVGRRKDGREFPAELSLAKWETAQGRFVTGIIRDITERKLADEQLRKLSRAVEQSPESIVITNLNAEIEYVNEAFVQNTGYTREEAIGKNPRILQSGKTPPESFEALWDALTHGHSWKGEMFNKRKDGSEYVESAIITPIHQPDGCITHYIAVKEDITSRKAAADKINALAFYDPLTGLPNRRLLLDRLQQALASSTRSGRQGALLFIDLDNFKTLNDTLGHDIGDLLLQQVAQRLIACIREGDTVARLGGDEFVVMLEDLSENSQEAATQAEIVGEKIIATLNQPYQLAIYSQHSTPSIGVTLFAHRQESIDDLLKQADMAMYQAKAAGRNTLRFFDPKMQAVVTTRAALEADLREAILKDQFHLYYQSQVADKGRLTGVEVLLRWQHPERGLVSPAEFIPIAEETGLILPLGHWVLQTACRQLTLWAARPEMAHLTIAVNVSARQFRLPNFVEEVLAILGHSGANPQLLKLELTESLLVDDVEDVIAKMVALKAKGVGFSLDDFGTGYSSLSYLKRLPLDQLKIDQSFVRDILIDPNDAAIAKMIVALAESMGLAVIAEGVEIEAQKDFLARQGCLAYQGYLFSRPLPLEEFEAYAKMI